MPRRGRSARTLRYGAPDDDPATEDPIASERAATVAPPECEAAGGLYVWVWWRDRRPVRRNAAAKARSARTAAAAADATTMAALGVPPLLPWTRGAGPVPEEDASAATVLGGGGGGSSAGPPFSGGTGVEGSAAKPGPGGAVEEGGGVHSMGKSGSCSTRRTSPAEAGRRRRRNEVSVRSRGIAGRREKEFLE
jgi:hypothetical protein